MPYLESQSVWLRCRMATLLRVNVLRYFLNETMAFRDSPTDSAEEGLVSLSAFRLAAASALAGDGGVPPIANPYTASFAERRRSS
jgi:hypothetical protein